MGCSASSPETSAPQAKRPLPSLSGPLLLPDPRPEVDVTMRGVALSFLQRLVSSGALDATWTIQEAVDRFVRPTTAATRCCLFGIINPSATGRPTHFISHTWSRRVGDLLGLLTGHFQQQGGTDTDPIIWLDIVAINQHPYVERGCLQNDDVASLAKVVAATDLTLFCLDNECVSLTRIWCLFEVWHTFLAKGAKGLLLLTSTVDAVRLTHVFETFDILKAQATQPEDKDRILAEVKGSIGSTALNLQLKAALVNSAVYQAEHSSASGLALAMAQDKAGQLCYANGQYGLAEPLYRQTLEARERLLGPDHADTISAVNNLANCVGDQGRAAEAEPLNRRALDARTRVLGPDHPDTISSVNNLASCIDGQGRGTEAEPLYRQALEARSRVLGPDHPDTISCVNNLASCINGQGRRAEAEPLYRQSLEARSRVLGPDHPDTIGSVNNLAICMKRQGRPAEAEPLYRQALEARERVLGPDHPDTISSVSNLANCISDQGRTPEAEPMYRQAIEARGRVLGLDHPDTGDCMYNLAHLLQKAGRKSSARGLFLSAAQVYERAYGPEHDETKDAMRRADNNKE